MKHLFIVTTLLFFTACNSDDALQGETCAHDLDAVWLKSGSPRIELDYRGIQLGTVASLQVDYTNTLLFEAREDEGEKC